MGTSYGPLFRIQGLKNSLEDRLYQDYDRLLLWGPVFFAAGIGGYFTLSREPSLHTGGGACLMFAILLAGVRRIFLLRLLMTALLLAAAGFSTITLRSYLLDTPVLDKKLSPRLIVGEVSDVRHYSNGKLHIVIRDPLFKGGKPLRKVRVKVHNFGELPYPGDRIRLRAGLLPPPSPAMPEDFDYARQIWFQGIGAVGYALSEPEILAKGATRFGISTRKRLAIAEGIRRTIPGDDGGLAAALITGLRDGISPEVADDMRNAGLAHLLAISGLHMGLLCGAAFFFARFLLSRSKYLALRHPIKKWAAVVAIGAGLVYVQLSGGTVPTVRAFMMVLIVLIGVLVDRKAISLRLVAIAAMVILIMTPEMILSVSFQMSFGAVVALVVAYERFGSRWFRLSGQNWRGKLLFFVATTLFTTLVAELAIAPFALYHFNKLVQYGLVANLLAMPVMAFWVMPFVVAYLVLAPLGLGALALYPMAYGLELIILISQTVSETPGSYRMIPAIGLESLLLIALGVLWFGIWNGRWRFWGAPVVAAGIVAAFFNPRPDILIDNGGRLIGVKNADEEIRLSSLRAGRMTRERWAQRFGQEAAEKWSYDEGAVADAEGSANWMSCDELSCLYRPAHKSRDTLIALVKDERALGEDCRHAQVVISLVPVHVACPSARLVIDRWDFYHKGGHALWLPEESGGWITVKTVAATRGDRPWSRRR